MAQVPWTNCPDLFGATGPKPCEGSVAGVPIGRLTTQATQTGPRVIEVQLTPEEKKAWNWSGIKLHGVHRALESLFACSTLYCADSGKALPPDHCLCAVDADRGICKEHIEPGMHRFTRRNVRIDFDRDIHGLPNPLIVRGLDMAPQTVTVDCKELTDRIPALRDSNIAEFQRKLADDGLRDVFG